PSTTWKRARWRSGTSPPSQRGKTAVKDSTSASTSGEYIENRYHLISAMHAQDRSIRTTDQRRAIERLLRQSTRPLTAHELFLALRDSGNEIGLATVYRNLKR